MSGEPTARRDIGDRCVFCGASTAVGSGRFVNRVPAETTADQCDWLPAADRALGTALLVEGYACANCLAPDPGDECHCPVCSDCDGAATHDPAAAHPDYCDWCEQDHGGTR